MKRKSVLFIALTLIAITGLVTGCNMEPPEGYSPPAGMGAVRLNLSNTIARASTTALPDGVGISTFVAFKLEFTTSVSANDRTLYYEYTELSAANIALAPGDYTLVVTGYVEDTATGSYNYNDEDTEPDNVLEAAKGQVVVAGITAGTTKTFTVTLRAISTTGNGTFTWDIDATAIDADVDSAEMTVSLISNPATKPINARDISAEWDGTFGPIPAGSYYVDFAISVDGAMKYFRHVLQIYQNMDSKFTYEFTLAHFAVTAIQENLVVISWNNGEYPPDLSFATTHGQGTAVSPISLTGTDSIVITVSNAADIDGTGPLAIGYSSIEWEISYYDGTNMQTIDNTVFDTALTVSNSVLTIAANNTIFAGPKAKGTLQLSVIGRVNGVDGDGNALQVSSSTELFIQFN